MKTIFPDLLISYQPASALKDYPRNARTHSKHQIRQIADSIKAFGFVSPVLISQDNTIIAGHGRVAAAKLLGITRVPTIQLDNLSPDDIRAYVLADNRLAEKAGWDRSILAIEFQHLQTAETDYDITITGFEMAEVDLILTEASDKPDPDDSFEVSDSGESVTRPGDVWLLGKHRILCGSALEQSSYAALMGRNRASVVFSDPPYNVEIKGNVCGNGAIQHREFQMASGEMSELEFITFLTASLRLLAQYSTSGSVHFICIDWRHIGELLGSGRQVYDSILNLCVWVKDKGGMGSLYRSQHELVVVFKNGNGKHRNNVQLGRYGRNRTNVWEYPGVNTFARQTDEGNLQALHPTVKPIALVADAILDCSARRSGLRRFFSIGINPDCGRAYRPSVSRHRTRLPLCQYSCPTMATIYRRPRCPRRNWQAIQRDGRRTVGGYS
jgi:hypothetical protein